MELTTAPQEPALGIVQREGQNLDGLLSKYSPLMYRAALRKLGNTEDAEDALQDALLSASRNLGQFKGECHISTWLVAIAINSARMQLRRRLRHKVVSLDQTSDDGTTTMIYEPVDCRPNPEEIYKVVEMRGIIGRLTARLSPPLHKAFRLRVLEGLSIHEAARLLGVTEGTLKAQLFRARARINALMHQSAHPSRDGRSRGKVHRRRTTSHSRIQ